MSTDAFVGSSDQISRPDMKINNQDQKKVFKKNEKKKDGDTLKLEQQTKFKKKKCQDRTCWKKHET